MKLNRKGYLTIEIILGAVIAFGIAFFLIEITTKLVSVSEDNYKDTIVSTDNALIISGVKEVVENNIDGINIINCSDNSCTITYLDNNIGTLKIEDHTVEYVKRVPDDETTSYDKYEKELDSSLSDIKLTSNIDGEVTNESNIYFKISGKNIYSGKDYEIIIPIDNLKQDNVCNIPSVTSNINLATYITNLYNKGEKEIVTNNNIEYNTVSCLGLMNDRLGSSSINIDSGNIRYYGASPNNYIYFNCDDYSNQTSDTCELWRIIGVFDNKVKIMRNSSIGDYPWDNKDTSTGAEDDYGKNDWSDARLMKLLNSGYESESVGGSLYWNAGSGNCYYGWNNATKACDFTSTGLKNMATRNLISESTYSLLGYNDGDVYTDVMYNKERTTGNVYSTTRSTSWTGKVALAYLSDYGYAADLRECNQTLYYYGDSTCTSNNWMKNVITNNGSSKGWLLTPTSILSGHVWYIYSDGYATYYNSADYDLAAVPVLFLNADIEIKGGNIGNSDDPYKLIV